MGESSAMNGDARRALARVNLAAIERNPARACGARGWMERVSAMRGRQGQRLRSRRRAQRPRGARGRASRLAVAGAREAVELREAGFLDDVPVLVMGALSRSSLRSLAGATPRSWSGTSRMSEAVASCRRWQVTSSSTAAWAARYARSGRGIEGR